MRNNSQHQKHIIERKPEIVAKHIHTFGQSLYAHIKHYAHLFYSTPDPKQLGYYPAYLCPLCVSKGIILFEDGFVDNGADFTLDHFPPKNVGGTQMLLVCRSCNSDAGQFENDLKRKLQDRSFDSGIPTAERKIKSSISTITGSYPGTLTMGNDNKINISFKENEKIHSPLLDNWLARPVSKPDWTAEIKYFVADEKKVTKSMLKTAYLFCFQYWGYSFCFSETGKLFRDVIGGKIEYPLANNGFWLTEKMKDLRLPLGLCTLGLPHGLKFFCVNVLLSDQKTKHQELFSIIVPGPHKDNWSDLNNIDALIVENPNFDISLKHVENFSVENGKMNGYHAAWQEFSGS